MAYKNIDLIKKYNLVRDYMREFFVYGFKYRGNIGEKSDRTYDDRKRQIESWLGDYMSFKQSASGKAQFISVDSREVVHNPLYKAFKSSSFTTNDILLHFCILDCQTAHCGRCEQHFIVGAFTSPTVRFGR